MNNWPPLDTEVAAKIKSAKYHALRILHAIRAGDDPNITDQVEQTAPDEPIQNVSAGNGDVSPLAPSPSRPSSGGYFPRTDPNLASELDRQGPSAPPPFIDQVSPIDHPHMSQPTSPNFPVHQPHPQPPPYSGFSPQYSPAPPQVPYQPPAAAPMAPYGQPSLPPAVPQYSAPPPMPPTSAVDEEAITLAQKHAKWAISALNFDDVSTAIRELRLALQALGAR